ncbi:MarR family winged helix-turn-helix transcriptional regulator [Chachezhania antarctica]|uniref:MarR family winged helix-turn-helix transcriptional regulator n=1 Tax=Chachezhania antarctica TaxID=2340860 RepID=UPI001F0892F3|nr:MarR family winged helix-turn-helix transcriptional regulator [Chachezhania antarctica]|tara:strand:+ start:206 stop:679 length:474 start_codon:yes stop_codon:yes gene_type:complete
MTIRQKLSMDPQAADVRTNDLEDLVGYNLKRAYVILSADFKRTLGEDGFAPRVFSALSLIVQYPDITQSELARMLGIERSGLVAIVDQLEQRGFVQRNAVPGDRRVQALMATGDGCAAYEQARASVEAHEEKLLSHMTPRDVETLLGLLRKIREIEE